MNSLVSSPVTEQKDSFARCWESVPDEELLELVHRSRSCEAMGELVDRFAPLVASITARHLRSPHAREEAFQATFLVLFQSAHRIRKKTSLRSFLFGVALRVSKRLRAQESQQQKRLSHNEDQTVESLAAKTIPDPFDLLAQRLQTAVLDEELALLPETLRIVLVDHYFANKSAPEIAKSMNLSVSAVEGRLKRGKQRLRSRLACRGVSLTACLSAIQTQMNSVANADYCEWNRSLLDYSSDPTMFDTKSFASNENQNQNLQKLVQGELQMNSYTTPPWLFWSGSVCLIILVGMGMLQVSNGGPVANQSGDRTILAPDLSSGDRNTVDQAALLQMGGMGGMGMDRTSGVDVKEIVNWVSEPSNAPKWLVASPEERDGSINQNIRIKLFERIPNVTIEAPLQQFAIEVSQLLDIPVTLDLKSLGDAAIAPDEMVSIQRSFPIKTKDLLQMVLDPLGCTYVIKYDSIVITSIDSDSSMLTRYYDLSYVFPNNSTLPQLLNSIEASVTPSTWEANSGLSTMTILGSMLVVRAPEETHHGIEDFLRQISKQSKDNLKTPSATPPVMPQMGGMM